MVVSILNTRSRAWCAEPAPRDAKPRARVRGRFIFAGVPLHFQTVHALFFKKKRERENRTTPSLAPKASSRSNYNSTICKAYQIINLKTIKRNQKQPHEGSSKKGVARPTQKKGNSLHPFLHFHRVACYLPVVLGKALRAGWGGKD